MDILWSTWAHWVSAPAQHTEIQREGLAHEETTNRADRSTRIHPAWPRSRPVHLSSSRSHLRRLVAVGASIRPRPEAGAPVPTGAAPVGTDGGRPLTTLARQSSQDSHAPTNPFIHRDPTKAVTRTTPHPTLPASLVEELVNLLAEALTADFTQIHAENAGDRSSSSVVSNRGIPPKNALVRQRSHLLQ